MRYLWCLVLCLGLLACQGNTQDKTQLKSQRDSVAYSIGVNIGKNLKQQGVDVDPGVLAKGLRDALTGSGQVLSDSQIQIVMTSFQQQMMAKQQEKMRAEGEKNKKLADSWLADNKKKENVVTLPSGLQYKIIKMGTGKKPLDTSTVSVNYRGTLIDGTEFDNSYKRGEPATFPINGVIQGWSEALKLMPVGSKWQLFVPPDLAYGERGMGQVIPPNSALIFEVELLSIK